MQVVTKSYQDVQGVQANRKWQTLLNTINPPGIVSYYVGAIIHSKTSSPLYIH